MHRLVRWSLVGLISCVTITTIAALCLTFLVDPNKYKGLLEEEIERTTGYVLDIDGQLSWSFIPSLGVSLDDARLSRSNTSRKNPIAHVKTAQIQLDLLPLVKKIASITLVLQDADITLRDDPSQGLPKNAQNFKLGQTVDLGDRAKTIDSDKAFFLKKLRLRQVKIQNSSLYTYKANGEAGLSILNLNLETQKSASQLKQPVRANFKLSFKAGETYPVEFLSNWHQDDDSAESVFTDIAAKLMLGQESLPLAIHGSLKVKPWTANLSAEGDLKASIFSPHLALNDGTSHLDSEFKLNIDKGKFKLSQLQATAGPARFTGALEYAQPSDKISFDIGAEKFNFNVLLPFRNTDSGEDKVLPIDLLRKLNIQGRFRGTDLNFERIHFPKFSFQINSDKGLIDIPIDFMLEQSQHQAAMQLNVRGSMPQLKFREHTQHCDIATTLKNIVPRSPLRGRLDLEADLMSQGNTQAQLLGNLQGRLNIEMTEGQLLGFDLSALLSKSETALKQGLQTIKAGQNLSGLAKQTGQSWAKSHANTPSDLACTHFSSLKASGQLDHGILHNKDLNILASNFQIKGQGLAKLPTRNLDYYLEVYSLKAATDANTPAKVHQTPLKLRVRGSFDQPQISPDIEAYFKDTLKALTSGTLKQLNPANLKNLFKDASSSNQSDTSPAGSADPIEKLKSIF